MIAYTIVIHCSFYSVVENADFCSNSRQSSPAIIQLSALFFVAQVETVHPNFIIQFIIMHFLLCSISVLY